ncbi:hypothetical protein FZ934_20185 (plasmid) [Rhizobium grahamii]|uniref:Uncharacterized protein n=1 Tax=Rhizobium grahamii TaxID=1120045 RepID=A0A5Q0CFH1_9HYPH|nr:MULTISPECIES: hypothetical protein [Rhizobium]QFY62701.1 hypothetical protein FZ934_20185 [Rhizobium grahamii]QRM52555.1 hypothetical protein F3Y33_25475 [Rhizobium sp. BG6]
MTFRITDLHGFNPVLIEWMTRRWGESCTGTELLILLGTIDLARDLTESWGDHHYKLGLKIQAIAKMVRRPLLIPSLTEFLYFVDDYWSDERIRSVHFSCRAPAARSMRKEIEMAIVAHEKAAAPARIGAGAA